MPQNGWLVHDRGAGLERWRDTGAKVLARSTLQLHIGHQQATENHSLTSLTEKISVVSGSLHLDFEELL
jgi:hypothetical protein